MIIYGIEIDVQRGFDVFRGSKLLGHFSEYSEAAAKAAEKGGRWIRYWELKKEG